MNKDVEAIDEITRISFRIQRIEGFMKSGLFINAYRESCNILADIKKGEGYGGEPIRSEIKMHLKRIVGFLHNIVSAYSEAEKLAALLRREKDGVVGRSEGTDGSDEDPDGDDAPGSA